MSSRHSIAVAILFGGTVFLAGCAGSVKTADVSGTVSYNGTPVPEGSISFVAADGTGPTVGGAIKDGKYSATKVPLGQNKVSISGLKVVGKKKAYDTPGSPENTITAELLPAKYNTKTELTLDVTVGANQKNWELAK